ncbi:hypothetical protein [Synechococcus phage S-E7]|uniref:Uncharacterized protein n=1 Tax=Synechococcus phage S-P4 TaxID=2484640 RepID=A0A3G3M5R8_9CAUD|nr:hypothetical protein HOU57_gp004 [Synechococcus phage S-P4]AYR01785.1 hypothetical protein [Synechococcus phage S-P4]AYR02159.1 hypothetical protein [Synechococcus phage S-E7]
MGKTFRRGGNERGYYSFGKSIRDKRQRGTNRYATEDNYHGEYDNRKSKADRKNRKFDPEIDNDNGWY